jgi:hypothetical protein
MNPRDPYMSQLHRGGEGCRIGEGGGSLETILPMNIYIKSINLICVYCKEWKLYKLSTLR